MLCPAMMGCQTDAGGFGATGGLFLGLSMDGVGVSLSASSAMASAKTSKRPPSSLDTDFRRTFCRSSWVTTGSSMLRHRWGLGLAVAEESE